MAVTNGHLTTTLDDESSMSTSVLKTAEAVAKRMRTEGSHAFSMTLRSASKTVGDTTVDSTRRINEATNTALSLVSHVVN